MTDTPQWGVSVVNVHVYSELRSITDTYNLKGQNIFLSVYIPRKTGRPSRKKGSTVFYKAVGPRVETGIPNFGERLLQTLNT